MTKWLNVIHNALFCGGICMGLVAWLALILGAFLGLAGWEAQAERMFVGARDGGIAFIALLLGAIVLTVARPNN